MLQKTVTEIPAHAVLRDFRKQKQKLRVAAYCRVSTEEEEQQNSFEVQVSYYTDKITLHDNWQLDGIFADDGISGVSTRKREQFNEMMELCRKKKIDLILTKSISRFARNTLDCIKYVRILKSWGIPVIFEKENINTENMTSEMILTFLSSFAQAESESISQNVARGKRMGYKQGKFTFRYSNFLGYRKGADGQPEIVPEEAAAIRMIFQSYLDGDSLQRIKEKLESGGVLTATGRKDWTTQAIQRILQNEKYMGDVLLQKTFTANFLEGRPRKNNGELPKYYIENNHPAIVSREVFHRVQEEIARRKSKHPAAKKHTKTNRGKFTSKYALSERLVCGDCGSSYRRVTWSIHGRRQIVWRCINRIENGPKACPHSPSIEEETLHSTILKAIQSLIQEKQEEISAALSHSLIACAGSNNDTDSPIYLQNRLTDLEKEFDHLLLRVADEDDSIDEKIRQVSEEIRTIKEKQKERACSEQHARAAQDRAKEVSELLAGENPGLTEYSDTLVYRIVEQITVPSKEEIRIRFTGGLELTQKLENVR